ncbi:MAG TPA: hypothetical protein VG944_12095 [Fimbriimonas sp.]|nr:hypothetical protein [Fimbriimonas sp.]
MFFCLRVDLDYVPWDTPDAKEFGHGEPAVLLRMLELARSTGYKFHFFISNRTMQALPSEAEAILNEGHDLDWLCKHPEEAAARFEKAAKLFGKIGHQPIGFAYKGSWPHSESFGWTDGLSFFSAMPGPAPEGLRFFPVETKSAREAIRAGTSVKSWADTAKSQIREAASRHRGVTLVIRPQVMGRYDAKLGFLHEILDLAQAVGATPKSLRDVLAEGGTL